MAELRWLLIIIGVVIIIAVYAYTRYQSHAKGEKEFSRTPSPSDPLTNEKKNKNIDIPSLRIKISETEPHTSSELPKITLNKVDEPQPSQPSKPAIEPLLVILHVWARSGQVWQGEQLMEAAEKAGLQATDVNIFQYFHQSNSITPLFHVADKTEPGTFEWDQMAQHKSQGVSLFMELPVAFCSADQAFLLMHACAERLADLLDGELLDQSHEPLEQKTIDEIHEQCQAMDDKL